MSDISVTCRKCGWVHFTQSRQQAEENITSFNSYLDSLPREQQNNWAPIIRSEFVNGKHEFEYGEPRHASISTYEHCMRCGGSYTNFRDYEEGDCPDGVTINPILHYDEPPRREDV